MCTPSAHRSQKRTWDSCDPSCGHRESNLGPVEDQPVLLTAEPFLQLHCSMTLSDRYIHSPLPTWLCLTYTFWSMLTIVLSNCYCCRCSPTVSGLAGSRLIPLLSRSTVFVINFVGGLQAPWQHCSVRVWAMKISLQIMLLRFPFSSTIGDTTC